MHVKRLLAAMSLTMFAAAGLAAPTIPDSDGDGIADSIELYFCNTNVTCIASTDTDGDGIPDFIEQNLTFTNPAVDDRVLCSGTGGASNITGQWDIRITSNLANPIDFKTDGLVAMSLCHTGSGVTTYMDAGSYLDVSTFDGTNYLGQRTGPPEDSFTLSAVYTAGVGTFSMGRLEGTFTQLGSTWPFRADRRAMTPPASSAVSGLYGLQVNELLPTGDAIDRPTNPRNFGGQIVVGGAAGTSAVIYTEDGIPMPGYYVPSVGALIVYNRFAEVTDADGDSSADDLVVTDIEVRGQLVEAASSKIGGMMRGDLDVYEYTDLNYLSSPGTDSWSETKTDFYGKAQVPQAIGYTDNQSSGARTVLFLANVPISADRITVAGDGLSPTDLVGGSSGKTMDDAVLTRSRLPGFTDGEAVGLAGNGSDLQITRVAYNSGGLLLNGNYSFTFTGDADAGTTNPVNFTYAQPALLLPIPSGVTFDSVPISTGTPVDNVNPGVSHTLAWSAVPGAAKYVVRCNRTDDSSNEWQHSTTSPSMSLDPRTFAPGASYRIRIRAWEGTAPPGSNNRSRTDNYFLNTGSTFADVPVTHFAWRFIEALALARITSGCDADNYCPANSVTRAQMAIFLERGMRGYTFTPPPATGTVFGDVSAGQFAAAWIEQLAADGITSGCGGGNYCPSQSVNRAQMAVFLLRAIEGSGYAPPACIGTMFADVSSAHPFCAWIEELARRAITSGCGGGNYCPATAVNRAQMAIFLQRAFNLPLPE